MERIKNLCRFLCRRVDHSVYFTRLKTDLTNSQNRKATNKQNLTQNPIHPSLVWLISVHQQIFGVFFRRGLGGKLFLLTQQQKSLMHLVNCSKLVWCSAFESIIHKSIDSYHTVTSAAIKMRNDQLLADKQGLLVSFLRRLWQRRTRRQYVWIAPSQLHWLDALYNPTQNRRHDWNLKRA